MQGQSNLVKTVQEQCDARKKTFLEFKDSHGNRLNTSTEGGKEVCPWESKRALFALKAPVWTVCERRWPDPLSC